MTCKCKHDQEEHHYTGQVCMVIIDKAAEFPYCECMGYEAIK